MRTEKASILDEVIERVNPITLEDTNALMHEILTGDFALALVGRNAQKLADKMKA